MEKVAEYIPKMYMGKRIRVALNTGKETIVEQNHRETNNINKIVKRYQSTGQLPPGREGRFEDVSNIGEYHDVVLRYAEAIEAYENLPPAITDQFNDPQEFLEYVEAQNAKTKMPGESSPGQTGNPEMPGQTGNTEMPGQNDAGQKPE